MKDLQRENRRFRRAVADLTLGKSIHIENFIY